MSFVIDLLTNKSKNKKRCNICGKPYSPRGEWDCGICVDCEKRITRTYMSKVGGQDDRAGTDR